MSFFRNEKNWPLKPLKEIATLKRGYDLPVQKRVSGEIPIYAANGENGSHNESMVKGPGVITGRSGTIGKVHYVEGDFWPLNTTLYVEDFHGNDPRWVMYMLRFFKLERFVRGAGVPTLNRNLVHDELVPHPPLYEQKCIAAILDKVDQLRQKRQQAIGLADEFLRSVFLDMFGDTKSNGWDFTTVENLAADYKGSMRTGPFGSQLLHSEFTEQGISVLGIDNAVQNTFKWAKPRFISEEKYQELTRYTVKPDDVITTIMGTCGRCAVVPAAINTKHLCAITLDQSKCLPRFLHSYFLMHSTARKYLMSKAKGAIMSGLNMGVIKELPVPVVPLDLQQKYQNICVKYDLAISRLNSSDLVNEDLFNSLSQKAFAGEL